MIDRHDLTDAEWAMLEPLPPDRAVARRGRQWLDHRQVINGVLWRTRNGSPWRDLPGEFGNWKTVYMRHRRWSMDGTWERVLDEVRRGCDQGGGRPPTFDSLRYKDCNVVGRCINNLKGFLVVRSGCA